MPYIIAQMLCTITVGGVLYLITIGKIGFDATAGFASNGYGKHCIPVGNTSVNLAYSTRVRCMQAVG